MAVDLTSMDYALRELVADGVSSLVYTDNPFLALIPKDTDFVGDAYAVAVHYGDTQGRSATYATAKANAGAHKGVKFLLTRAKDYAYGSIDRETMKAAEKQKGSIVKALEKEVKSATNQLKRSLGRGVWGKGSGKIGKIAAAGISGSTITLETVADSFNFYVGQKLVLSTADGGGAVKSGTLTVAGINRDTGVITTTVAVTTGIASAAAADFIFNEGDYDQGMKGFLAWVPTTAPTSTPFFGVDRSVDTRKLGGIRYDGSALPHDEALIEAAALVALEGGKASHIFMNPLDMPNLLKRLGSRIVYDDLKGPAGITFKSVVMPVGNSECRVLTDPNAPKGYAAIVTLDSWKLASLGEAPHMVEDDGLMIRRGTGDDFIFELASYANVGCDAPGHNALVTLATT